jgi:DNA repair photolyase
MGSGKTAEFVGSVFVRYTSRPSSDPVDNVRTALPVRQPSLFPELDCKSGDGSSGQEPIERQADIAYVGTRARSVLNPPERTGMPYWSINPYIGCAFGCAYCYARYAHRYVSERAAAANNSAAPTDDAHELPPWLAFERRVYVKLNAPQLVRQQLTSGRVTRRPGPGASLVIGTATDPYQPAERRFRLTRGVLEALADHGACRTVVITKSPLITRDVDVLQRLAARVRFTVHLSLITLDTDLARRLEPRAPTPQARLRAIARLRAADIDVGINIMPVLPGITDDPRGLEALVSAVASEGATHINAGTLRLQSEARRRYLPFIDQEFPHLARAYRATYATASIAGDRYRAGLTECVKRICERAGIRFGS